MSLSSSTPSRIKSLAGAFQVRPKLTLCWMLWNKRCMIAVQFTKVALFIIRTAAGNISPSAIPSDWPWQGLNPLLAASVTLTITPSRQIALQSPVRQCLAETINGLYKAEVIHRLGPWKTMAAVEWETLKWVDWFNNRRLLEPIHCPAGDACITERGLHPTSRSRREVLCTVRHIRYGRMR
jgi:hypothetical protein